MFSVSIEGKSLYMLEKLAEGTGQSFDLLAQRAVRKGLRELAKPRPWSSSRTKPLLEVNAYIRLNWERQTDGEMAKALGYTSQRIGVHRHKMRLFRTRGRPRSGMAAHIDPVEFERMVMNQGYTMTEYAEIKGIKGSKQRLWQVVISLGLKHSPKDRAPEWHVARRKRLMASLLQA